MISWDFVQVTKCICICVDAAQYHGTSAYICAAEWADQGVSEGLVRAKSDRHRGVEVHISADRHKLQLNHQAATAKGKVGNIIFGESMQCL